MVIASSRVGCHVCRNVIPGHSAECILPQNQRSAHNIVAALPAALTSVNFPAMTCSTNDPRIVTGVSSCRLQLSANSLVLHLRPMSVVCVQIFTGTCPVTSTGISLANHALPSLRLLHAACNLWSVSTIHCTNDVASRAKNTLLFQEARQSQWSDLVS